MTWITKQREELVKNSCWNLLNAQLPSVFENSTNNNEAAPQVAFRILIATDMNKSTERNFIKLNGVHYTQSWYQLIQSVGWSAWPKSACSLPTQVQLNSDYYYRCCFCDFVVQTRQTTCFARLSSAAVSSSCRLVSLPCSTQQPTNMATGHLALICTTPEMTSKTEKRRWTMWRHPTSAFWSDRRRTGTELSSCLAGVGPGRQP